QEARVDREAGLGGRYRMLNARITSSNAALYIATDATPYDLETLYRHAAPGSPAPTVELQVEPGASHDPEITADLSTLVHRLSDHGVRVRLSALDPRAEERTSDSRR